MQIEGTLNFRDIGGYATSSGATVRTGLVYRSDSLAEIDDGGWEKIRDLGIREIFDLRHDFELSQAPYDVPDGIASTRVAIGPREAEARDVIELLRSGGEDDFGIDYMIEMYRKLFEEHAGAFGALLTHLADARRLPAVYHCTAGKDRTGIATALILSVLGVARETILDDYELSNEYRFARRMAVIRPRLEEAGIDFERVKPYLMAPRPALEAALMSVDLEYGGVEGFLTKRAGVAPDSIGEIRTNLLEL